MRRAGGARAHLVVQHEHLAPDALALPIRASQLQGIPQGSQTAKCSKGEPMHHNSTAIISHALAMMWIDRTWRTRVVSRAGEAVADAEGVDIIELSSVSSERASSATRRFSAAGSLAAEDDRSAAHASRLSWVPRIQHRVCQDQRIAACSCRRPRRKADTIAGAHINSAYHCTKPCDSGAAAQTRRGSIREWGSLVHNP